MNFITSEILLPNFGFIAMLWATITAIVPVIAISSVFQFFLPSQKREFKAFSYEYWLDVLYALQPMFLGLTALSVASNTVSNLVLDSGWKFTLLQDVYLWAQILFVVWLADFLVYWRHRVEHEVWFLWPFHLIHHTSKKIDVLTTTRLHSFEVLLGGAITGAVGAGLGVDGKALMVGYFIYGNYNYFIHSNVRIHFPGFLKYIFVSPRMHRWHHALAVEAVNKNYGFVFSWNDWIFKTAYLPDCEPDATGVKSSDGKDVEESYIFHQFYPFYDLSRRLIGSVKNRMCLLKRSKAGGSLGLTRDTRTKN